MGLFAVGVAAGLELAIAEPPQRLHPVAWFGQVVALVDGEWSHPRLVGLAAVLFLPVAAAVVVGWTVWIAGRWSPWLGALVAGLALFVSTSLGMLLAEARSVISASETDVERARESLRALAGRDASDLTAGQVRSAAVESAAENLADGLIAPLGAFVLGTFVASGLGAAMALAAGAGAGAWVKAVNTLDSMLGYRTKPVGWAPARLDDLAMWLPARVSAVLLAIAARDPGAVGRARRWLDRVPSPNSGWPMGTLAAASGCRLEKPGAYVLAADAALPDVDSATAAVRTVAFAGILSYLLAALLVVIPWF